MAQVEASVEERQDELLKELRKRGSLTITEAWDIGHPLGFYKGGEATKVKNDLNALAQRNQARYNRGFWRTGSSTALRWSDYWTPQGLRRIT